MGIGSPSRCEIQGHGIDVAVVDRLFGASVTKSVLTCSTNIIFLGMQLCASGFQVGEKIQERHTGIAIETLPQDRVC